MDLKKPLTFDEQLDKLASHGIIISDREKAKDVLKRVNYYRVTGYALQFRQEPSGSCIFRKNCASVPEERSAIPLQTEQSSAG